MGDSFKNLASRLSSKQGGTEVNVDDHLTTILDEHLDLIAAAHHSVHGSQHHSHPSLDAAS
ncbi:hypothetical protein DBR17_07075 [Sphingomonas sp. HMWF008]|nr:hypothetical protein DBR17_07075 [Sphingomonas sp. HMWF008]